jgi:hypothetical protein
LGGGLLVLFEERSLKFSRSNVIFLLNVIFTMKD